MKIAWIGTGIMGSAMIKHLTKSGYDVSVYNRTLVKAEKLKDIAHVKTSIKDAVFDADVIFTIVGYPSDVIEVMSEIFKYAQKGSIIIDMTTSSPSLAIKLYEDGLKHQLNLLDAPVTGGETGAIKGNLSIMVGGDKKVFDHILPLLKCFGQTILHVGKAGNGQYTKLANQIAIAGALAGVVESLYFASKNDLDLNLVHQIMMGGSASSNQLATNGLKMIKHDYEPGFFIKHFLKDLNLAIEASSIKLEVATKVKEMLDKLVHIGFKDKGTQALMLYYLDSVTG